MAEFVVSAKLTAKNEMSPPVKQVTSDLDGLKRAFQGVTDAAKQQQAAAMGGLIRAFQQVEQGAKAQRKAVDEAANALRRKQQALRGIGIQMGDFGTQVATGGNIALAFGQQIGQAALAAEGFGGKVGAVAKFLSGPWGAAIQFGVILLGSMAGAFLSAKKAADDASKSVDLHKMSLRDLIKAINDEDAALRKQLASGQEAEALQIEAAARKRDEIALRRKNIATLLEEALAQAKLSAATAGGSEAGGALLVQAQARVTQLSKDLKDAQAALQTAETDIRLAKVPLINRFTEEGLDPAKKAAGDLERALYRLRKEYEKGGESAAEYSRKQALVRTEYARTMKAIQEADKSVNNNQTGKMITASEAAAIVRSIGGQVNSGTRTHSQQQALYDAWVAAGKPKDNPVAVPGTSAHEKGYGLDVQFAPGLDPAKLREAFREEGVTLTKVFAERGHWHIEWAGGAEQAAKAARDMEKAARDAKKAQDELNAATRSAIDAFDPAASATAKYTDELAKLQKLLAAGKINRSQFIDYSHQAFDELGAAQDAVTAKDTINLLGGDFAPAFNAYVDRLNDGIKAKFLPTFEDAGRAGAKAFQRSGVEAAREISAIIGGKAGNIFGDVLGTINGLQTGSFQGVGGKLGALLNLFSGNGNPNDPLGQSFAKAIKPLTRSVDGSLTKIGTALQGVGDAVPYIAAAMAATTALSSLFGVKNHAGGLFGLGGNLLINAITPAKKGSATFTSIDGAVSTSGNSANFKQAALGDAQNVQSALGTIADALGGSVGNFAVSIGIRDGKYRVDPTGRGITKTKKGAIDFGKDEAAAQAAALRDAIADGAIQGLSDAVQRALGSSTDLNKAVAEALKVQAVEDELSDLGSTVNKQFRDFEKQAKERVRIATQYGFDVVKIEKINADERAKLVEDILGSRVGSLKTLLDDLSYGDLFSGSITDQINKLKEEAEKARQDALAGVDGAADKLAGLERDIVAKALDAYGTAGPEYSQARADATSAAQQIIAAENDRIKAAQDAANETNAQLNEANDQLAEQTTLLRTLVSQGVGGGLGGMGGAVSTAFSTELR
jgi:LAS superfamily LD-carboxypeptidase LdcB